MDRERRVLQHGVQVAPVRGRRIQAHEGIGGRQREEQEAEAHEPQHAEHARRERRRQAAPSRIATATRPQRRAAGSTAAASPRARPTVPPRDRTAAARSWNSPPRTPPRSRCRRTHAIRTADRGRHHDELSGQRRATPRDPAFASEHADLRCRRTPAAPPAAARGSGRNDLARAAWFRSLSGSSAPGPRVLRPRRRWWNWPATRRDGASSERATSGGMYFSSCLASTSSATKVPRAFRRPCATTPALPGTGPAARRCNSPAPGA